MISYLKDLEDWAKGRLAAKGGVDWDDSVRFFRAEISVIQNERMAHLIVTMFVGLFLMLSFGLVIIEPRWESAVAGMVLLGLFIGYIRHYFLLENGLQRLYGLCLKMEKNKS